MIKTKVAFLEGWLLSSQSELIGWKKTSPPKKPLLFWSCKQAINVICPTWAQAVYPPWCWLFQTKDIVRVGVIRQTQSIRWFT